MRNRLALASLSFAIVAAACAASLAPSRALDARIDALLDRYPPDVAVSVWAGGPEGGPWFERDAEVFRPAASSIKTSYLVELFAVHAGSLDEPLAGAAEILAASSHPAIAHFDAATQSEIREHLSRASVREVARMMIRGTGVSNAVYNAAANLTTAVLGGPETLTGRIHARDPALSGLVARRYMLADRNATGDNEATAASLAAVLQRIAARSLAGADEKTADAIREVLFLEEDGARGRHFFKSGSLDTDPLARIRSGFWESGAGTLVYAVMVERPHPGDRPREQAGKELEELAERLAELVLETANGTP